MYYPQIYNFSVYVSFKQNKIKTTNSYRNMDFYVLTMYTINIKTLGGCNENFSI